MCVWCLESGVWCLVFGVWCLVFGVWCLVFGVWCLMSGMSGVGFWVSGSGVYLQRQHLQRRRGAQLKNNQFAEMCCGNAACSYLRLIDSCIIQLQPQGPSRTYAESKEEEEVQGAGLRVCLRRQRLQRTELATQVTNSRFPEQLTDSCFLWC